MHPRHLCTQGVTSAHVSVPEADTRSYTVVCGVQGWDDKAEASWREQDPEEQGYTWQLGRGLGGRDEEPEDDEALGVH